MSRTSKATGRPKVEGWDTMQRNQPKNFAPACPQRRGLARRRGGTLVLLALSMIVMFGMLAFAVDTGVMMHVRTDLQRTADACALAAARHLPDESAAKLLVRDAAIENGWEWTAWGQDAVDMAFGYWDRDEASFTSPAPPYKATNAIQVTLRRTRATKNPVTLFFGSVLGRSNADITASATAICDRWLCGPFVGIESVSVPGTPDTDSFDSDDGWYVVSESRDRGSICSDGPINVDGAAVVRGDARSGKGFDVTLTGGAQITGSVGDRKRPLNLPPADATLAASSNDNDQIPLLPKGKSFVSPVDANGNFLLDGNNSIDMPGGTYYFNDFTLAGSAVFNVTGPTTIYVTGNLYRGGLVTLTNSTGQASNLKIFMTGGTAHVTSGNDFYGVIYAPNTDVTIDGNSDLYGAVVGRTLTITGSGTAHYDEALDLEEVELPTRTALVD